MSNKFGNIKERVLQVADKVGVGRSKICEMIGLTYGNFTGKAKETPLNSMSIGNLLSIFPEINPGWLITGEGEMLLGKKEEGVPGRAPECSTCRYIKDVERYEKDIDRYVAEINRLNRQLAAKEHEELPSKRRSA